MYKGFVTDVHPSLQPENTYRYALNKLLNIDGTISDEPGTTLFATYNNNHNQNDQFIGEAFFPDGSMAIFFNRTSGSKGAHISVVSKSGVVSAKLAIANDTFHFNIGSEFKAKGMVSEDNHRLLLWTDGNDPYLLDIDALQSTITTLSELQKYKLFPDLSIPIIDSLVVNDSGGALKTGSYQLAICYNFDEFNKTDYLVISNPINIVASTLVQGYSQFTGSDGGVLSTKSITIELSNLDTKFPYFTLAAIKTQNGIVTAEEIGYYPFTGTSSTITYSGAEKSISILIEDITVPKNVFSGIKTFALTNKYLALGNLKIDNLPDYQSYANAIKTQWVYDWQNTNVSINGTTGTYKDGTVSFKLRSYMPGEVYAFYIAFRLNDGKRSPFYHIPGRDSILLEDDYFGFTMGDYENVKLSEASEHKEELSNDLSINPDIKWFHTRSTAKPENRTMGYWENEETYPSDFPNSIPIGTPPVIRKFAGKPVLHHKFPDITDLENWYNPYLTWDEAGNENGLLKCTISWNGDWNTSTEYDNFSKADVNSINPPPKLEFSDDVTASIEIKLVHSNITGSGQAYLKKVSNGQTTILKTWYVPYSQESLEYNYSFTHQFLNGDYIYFEPFVFANVNIQLIVGEEGAILGQMNATPLGIEFSNINVPNTINGQPFLSKVQGFEIYYAKRDFNNSTVITQGWLFGIDDTTKEATPGAINSNWCFHSSDLLNLESHPTINPDFVKVQRFITNFDYFHWEEGKGGTQLDVEPQYLIRKIYDVKYKPQSLEDRTERRLEGKIFTALPELGTGTNNDPPTKFQSSKPHVNLCNYRVNVYTNFNTQKLVNTGYYFPITTSGVYSTEEIYGGDTYINEDSFFVPDYNEGQQNCSGWTLYSHIFHTALPACLRQPGEQDYETFYPYIDANKISNIELPQGVTLCDLDNFVKINSDFAKLNDTLQLVPALDKYIGTKEYPNDIAYSIISNSNIGSLRNFFPNNYYSMPAHKGDIINLDAFSNNLYIHTPLGLFKTITQVKMKSDEEDVIMGSPDLFDVEPQDISMNDKGYGGTSSMSACLMTQFGYIWIDSNTGKVFSVSDNLEELSNIGNSKILERQLKADPRTTFGYLSRYFMAYDAKYKRLFLTKKETINQETSFVTYSFSMHSKYWESKHDAVIEGYTNDQNNLISINNGKIFKHDNEVNRCLFHGNLDRRESFIDVAIPFKGKHVTSLVKWISKAINLDGSYSYYDTFSNIIIYNSVQSTNKVALDAVNGSATKNTYIDKGFFSFNKLFDLKTNTLPPINNDYIWNSNYIVESKNWADMKKFIDEFIIIRFLHNDQTYNVSLHYVTADSRAFYM